MSSFARSVSGNIERGKEKRVYGWNDGKASCGAGGEKNARKTDVSNSFSLQSCVKLHFLSAYFYSMIDVGFL